MNWYKQSQFDDPYGYWMLKDGSIVSTGSMDHLEKLTDLGYDISKVDKEYGEDVIIKRLVMNKDGLVKLKTPYKNFNLFFIEFRSKLNMNQINKLSEMIKYYHIKGECKFFITKNDNFIYDYQGNDPQKAIMSLY